MRSDHHGIDVFGLNMNEVILFAFVGYYLGRISRHPVPLKRLHDLDSETNEATTTQ